MRPKSSPLSSKHHRDGIAGMNLIDLLEMFADWKASTERSPGGNIYKSLDINTRRFNIEPQLRMILIYTVNGLICGIDEDPI